MNDKNQFINNALKQTCLKMTLIKISIIQTEAQFKTSGDHSHLCEIAL